MEGLSLGHSKVKSFDQKLLQKIKRKKLQKKQDFLPVEGLTRGHFEVKQFKPKRSVEKKKKIVQKNLNRISYQWRT